VQMSNATVKMRRPSKRYLPRRRGNFDAFALSPPVVGSFLLTPGALSTTNSLINFVADKVDVHRYISQSVTTSTMSEDPSIFEVCTGQLGTDLTVELLQCVSDGAESVSDICLCVICKSSGE
jgi:hypothetical protein